MNTQRRLTVAAAAGSVVLCVVTACSSGSKSGQGSLGNLSAPSLSPSAGVSAPVTGLPTVRPSGTHTSPAHGTSSAPASSQPSGQPSGQPSESPSFIHVTFRGTGNYSVVATNHCYWNLFNDAGNIELQVGAEFTISYSGLLHPTQVSNFTFSNSLDGYHTQGPAELGTSVHYTGGQLLSVSPLAGAMVKVTGTIGDSDDNAADNSASVTVSMPTVAQINASGLTNGPATCS